MYLYRGGKDGLGSTPALTLPGVASPSVSFGDSLLGPGDVDGDGYEDVLVGAPGGEAEGGGKLHLYRGKAGGPATTPSQSVSNHEKYAEHFARPLAALGDVDGDGRADVFVGTESMGNTAGWVFLGSPRGLVDPPAGPLLLEPGP